MNTNHQPEPATFVHISEDQQNPVLQYAFWLTGVAVLGLVCFATYKLAPQLAGYVHAFLNLWGAK